jgi:hypothetical protein
MGKINYHRAGINVIDPVPIAKSYKHLALIADLNLFSLFEKHYH